MTFISILAYHALSLIMLTNQNFIIFVMQRWWYFVPYLKPSPRPHTHAHKYMKNKHIFLLSQFVAILATHHVLSIQEKVTHLQRGACIFIHIHTKYHLYVRTQ